MSLVMAIVLTTRKETMCSNTTLVHFLFRKMSMNLLTKTKVKKGASVFCLPGMFLKHERAM